MSSSSETSPSSDEESLSLEQRHANSLADLKRLVTDDEEDIYPVKATFKTKHEIDLPELPTVHIKVVDTQLEIRLLGRVTAITDTMVVVETSTSDLKQALDYGSVVCLEDRRVLGAVFETFGPVHKPLYSIRYANQEAVQEAVQETGVVKDANVYYVPTLGQYVYPENLRGLKGSDASNFWDEEVDEADKEFSDDEKEAEFRRQMKQKRNPLVHHLVIWLRFMPPCKVKLLVLCQMLDRLCRLISTRRCLCLHAMSILITICILRLLLLRLRQVHKAPESSQSKLYYLLWIQTYV